MNKEEAKQWLRNQIDSSIKTQSEYNKDVYYLCYNKSYLRALKLSKITGQPVNQNNFKKGVVLFRFNIKTKSFICFNDIRGYLTKNYTPDHHEMKKIIIEVFNEYEEYKDFNAY